MARQLQIEAEPLILERKTPAEALREVLSAIRFQNRKEEAIYKGERLLARLESPEGFRVWDGIYPWAGQPVTKEQGPCVYFSNSLRFYPVSGLVEESQIDERLIAPAYHDGLVLTFTVGDGMELTRLEKDPKTGTYWLRLTPDRHIEVVNGDGGDICYGVRRNPKPCGDPPPPGTRVRVTIDHESESLNDRWRGELLAPEKPPFEPLYLRRGVYRVLVDEDYPKIRLKGPTSTYLTSEEARAVADALEQAAEHLDKHLDPSQSEDAADDAATDNTVLPSELEFSCELNRRDKLQIRNVTLLGRRLYIRMPREGQTYFHSLTFDDEATLRDVLNRRHTMGQKWVS